MRPCNCGPRGIQHQVHHPTGAITTHASEDEAREVARQVGGTYQAIQM